MIGIVTFHRALNYGAVLQAFALRWALERAGAEVEVVDYRCNALEEPYQFDSFWHRTSMKQRAKWFLQRGYETAKRDAFDRFRQDYLCLSDTEYSRNTIASANNRYGLFVCGSDQVWNPNAHGFDTSYLLDFADPKKRVSFAASFGLSELPNDVKERYKELLGGFCQCSVREPQGLAILETLGLQGGRIDVDPTLLLTEDEWRSQIEITSVKRPHIFAYYFELSDCMRAFVEDLSRESGLPVMIMGKPLRKPFDCEMIYADSLGPIGFLEALSSAQYVVTNSFHGTALSIVFNRPVFIEMLRKGKSVNSRLENIVDQSGLEHRIIDGQLRATDFRSINWDEVNERRENGRTRSLEYIEGILK